jgi:nucleoside-diphosphate-sugar epimerase
MRVLILGCGYIGLPLGADLTRRGHQVFGLRRPGSPTADLTAVGISPLAGDLSRPEDLARLPGPYDWVVDCVASRGGGVEDYRRVYLQGARNVVAWLAPAPPACLVYTSSTSVYAQTDGSAVTETSPADPPAETAAILVETERVFLAAARAGTLPAVVLRLAGIYGPGRGYWFRQFLSGQARLEGPGPRLLNMIHRDDAVGAIQAALRHGRPGEIYNAVDDEPVTQLAFFQWLASALGRELPPTLAESGETARKRGLTHKRVLNHKLRAELQYQFQYPTFREGYAPEIQHARRLEPQAEAGGTG